MNIPIFLSSDNNYAPFVATTIASICDNTNSFIEFYILDGGITEENQEKICELKQQFDNFSIEFIKIDFDKYFKDFKETERITKSMYSRFLIPHLKPEIDKAIYSDVDVIVLKDIKELFDEDLEGNIIGAVWEKWIVNKNAKGVYAKYKMGQRPFYSGNLLIDCNRWRREDITSKLCATGKKYHSILNNPDQDILNIYFENNYKNLSATYCYTAQFCVLNSNNNIVIRHFNGKIKPWDIKETTQTSLMPNLSDFWHYAHKTSFYDSIAHNISDEITDINIKKLRLDTIIMKAFLKDNVKSPKISVIIPVYNAQDYLERCLDSVINQTLQDIEIICVNDCSTDASLEILKQYAKKDNRVKIIERKENGGESKARNTGLDNVEGEYIAFVDNDDTIDLDFFEKLYNEAKKQNADIARGEAHYIDYGGKEFTNKQYIRNTQKNKLCFSNDWWCGIFKTDLIKKNHITLPCGFVISADVIFLIKAVLNANKVATVEDIFYHHYDRENSGFSKYLSKEKIISGVEAVKVVADLLNDNQIYKLNPEGYDWVYKEQFNILLNIHYHNQENELMKLYVDKMFYLLRVCKRRDEFIQMIERDYPLISAYLIDPEYEKLLDILSKYKTQKNFLAGNLRKKAERMNI